MQVKSKWDCQDEDSTLGGTRSSLQPRDCGGKKNQLFYLGRGDWWRHDYKKQHLFCLFFILGVHGIQIYRVESNKLMKEVLFLFMPPKKMVMVVTCELQRLEVANDRRLVMAFTSIQPSSTGTWWDAIDIPSSHDEAAYPVGRNAALFFVEAFFSRNL